MSHPPTNNANTNMAHELDYIRNEVVTLKGEEPEHLKWLKASLRVQQLEQQNAQYKYIIETSSPLMDMLKSEKTQEFDLLSIEKKSPKPKTDWNEVNRIRDKLDQNLPEYCYECGAYIGDTVDEIHKKAWNRGRIRGKYSAYRDAFFVACLIIGIMMCFFIFGWLNALVGPMPMGGFP